MRRTVLALFVLLLPLSASAQQQRDPAVVLGMEWQAASTQIEHVVAAMREVSLALSAERQHGAETESHLKWVLDNWVPKSKPPAQDEH